MTLGAQDAETTSSILRRFGPIQDRVIFTQSCGGKAFVNLLGEIDVAIDPQPYGGCITSFDCLYHGVPILCLEGAHRVAQDAARLQSDVGETRFISPSLERFAATAQEVTNNLESLAATRASLRPRLLLTPAGQPDLWVRVIEDSFREMHQQTLMKEAA
jgi:predicted O-linked N-acetylglucosamine transferase (SPINDLY family)